MILLLSGGIDSAALCWQLRPSYALFVDYGHLAAEAELLAAKRVAIECHVEFISLSVNLREIGAGEMQHRRGERNCSPVPEWWPFRNQLLVTFAAAKAIELGCSQVIVGSVVSDRCMRDGTPEFVSKLNDLLNLQEGNIEVAAPAIELSSGELVLKSKLPKSILALTYSCHRGKTPCGLCRGCTKRIELYEAIGVL